MVENTHFPPQKYATSNDINYQKHSNFPHFLGTMTNLFDTLLNNSKLRPNLQFSRHSLPQLHDCQIKCNDNQLLTCHRCVLVARSEYFKTMLVGCWIESSQSIIDLPFDIDLMQIIVDDLYTDDIKMDFIHASDNVSAGNKPIFQTFIDYICSVCVNRQYMN